MHVPANFIVDFDILDVGELTAVQEEALCDLLKANSYCFLYGENDLGVTGLGSMNIQLTTEKLVYL